MSITIVIQAISNKKNLLADDQLIEIAYESFIKDPQSHIKHIYETLNLNTYDTFKDKLKEFISTQKNIRTSSYQLPETIKNEIWGAWQFSFNAFGYTR